MFSRTAHVYDLVHEFKDYEAEADGLAALILERNRDARSLLDVACGTGMHLWHLRRAFPELAGVDVEAGLLEVARGRLPGVPLSVEDMRTMDLHRRFDAVTCLFSSIGYLPTDADLDRAIGRMAAHLSSGGVLVLDGWVRPDRWRDPGRVDALSGGEPGLAVGRVSRSWRDGVRTVLEMRYVVGTIDGIETIDERHDLTLFTDEEYRGAFERAGLAAQVVPGPMGADRDRYVAVAP
jgi:SAM-dependent methyltransferase